MKRPVLLLSCLILFTGSLWFSSGCSDTKDDDVQSTTFEPSFGGVGRCFCAKKGADANQLCSFLPHDIDTAFGEGYNGGLIDTIQPVFDAFAWQTFIALNWPADSSGNPLSDSLGSHPAAPRVWESWESPGDVFKMPPFENACGTIVGARQLHQFSKMPLDGGDGGIEEADGFPLIDRNLNFVLYEIVLNADEAAYIRGNHLGTKAGQDSFTVVKQQTIELPYGKAGGALGAMEIKLAWRILDPAKDDTSRYFTRKASISVDSANSVSGRAFCIENVTVGLVGMHIIHKTLTIQNFMWVTFEHVDNVPDNLDSVAMAPGDKQWNFYNSNCQDCPVNNPPGAKGTVWKWDTVAPYASKYAQFDPSASNRQSIFGSQIVRQYPVYGTTQQTNRWWQQKLAGTVWANYMLVGNQWRHPDDPVAQDAIDAPTYLGNTAIESFMLSFSNCTTCHQGAKTASKLAASDFSFLFGYAQ